MKYKLAFQLRTKRSEWLTCDRPTERWQLLIAVNREEEGSSSTVYLEKGGTPALRSDGIGSEVTTLRYRNTGVRYSAGTRRGSGYIDDILQGWQSSKCIFV